ncbi:hypothetical protein OAO87_04505 [bacterium]|nr:hypothetical protein [bacterium]
MLLPFSSVLRPSAARQLHPLPAPRSTRLARAFSARSTRLARATLLPILCWTT